MQLHFLGIVGVIAAGLVVRLGPLDMAVLAFAIALVLVAEMFNTALEAWLDSQIPAFHPRVKIIKDIGAGAVMIAALNAVIVGVLIFSSNLTVRQMLLHSRLHRQLGTTQILLLGIIALLLLVVVIKERSARGSLLRGGIISGHSALAWFAATAVLAISREVPVQLLGLGLAALVSQSRIQAGIHRFREVFLGGVLGVAVAVAILLLGHPQ